LRTFIFVLTLLVGFSLKAQDPFYYRIDRSKGLPSNTVYDVFQDAKGFMWFSGSFGLCRYDGSQFMTFEANHSTSKSGTSIKQDKTGRIWYCNFDGKLLYVDNGQINQLKQNSEFGFFHFAIIDNYLYVIENKEIAVYDVHTLKKKFVIPFHSNKVICTHGSNSHFYIITDKLYIISSPTKVKQVPLPLELMNNLTGIMIQNNGEELFLRPKYGNVMAAYSNGAFKISKTNTTTQFVQNISTSSKGYWLSTTNGFIAYNNPTVSKASTYSMYLSDNNVSDVLEDSNGHLWVSTLDKGLRFIPDLSTRFFFSNDAPTTLFTVNNNKVLVGTDRESLHTTDTTMVRLKTLFSGETNHSFYMLYADTASNRIFGTSNSFKMFDLTGKLKTEVLAAVKDIVKVTDNVYAYSATWQCGLIKIGKKNTEWDSIFTSDAEVTRNELHFKPLIHNVRGKSVVFNESKNALFFSTNKGLYKVTPQKISEIKFKNESMNIVKLVTTGNFVLALSTDAQLYRINEKDTVGKIELEKTLNGQTPSSIKMLNNRLFLFTKNSLFQYYHTTNRVAKIISINDDFEWNDIALLKNKLIVSTNKGYIITSSSKNTEYSKPVLVIDSIITGKKVQLTSHQSTLSANNSNLHIYFSHVSYNPDNTNFVQYKVNDGAWAEISDNRNRIDIENLKSGKYQILIRYGNGFINSDASVLEVEIEKPFWLTWWFILLSISTLGVSIFIFDKWRASRINKKSQEIIDRIELEKSANQSKLKAIKSQMNPHFFFNALNTIQYFILDNDKKLAISYLNKFSTLTRSILEMSDKDDVSVEEEIKVLTLYLDIEKARFDNDFEYVISCNEFDTDILKIPTLLLQPFVENAVKHGLLHKEGAKELQIAFVKELDNLRIVISDNGIGRKKSMELNAIKRAKHSSFATKATEKRVDLLNRNSGKQITIQYIDEGNELGHAYGTTVIIIVPLMDK